MFMFTIHVHYHSFICPIPKKYFHRMAKHYNFLYANLLVGLQQFHIDLICEFDSFYYWFMSAKNTAIDHGELLKLKQESS